MEKVAPPPPRHLRGEEDRFRGATSWSCTPDNPTASTRAPGRWWPSTTCVGVPITQAQYWCGAWSGPGALYLVSGGSLFHRARFLSENCRSARRTDTWGWATLGNYFPRPGSIVSPPPPPPPPSSKIVALGTNPGFRRALEAGFGGPWELGWMSFELPKLPFQGGNKRSPTQGFEELGHVAPCLGSDLGMRTRGRELRRSHRSDMIGRRVEYGE